MHRRFWLLLLCLALVAAACGGGEDNTDTTDPAEDGSADVDETDETDGETGGEETEGEASGADWPEEIVLGLVPSREADVLVESAEPLAEALESELGISVESLVPSDYTALIEAMGAGQADIGAFGPLALVRAQDRYGVDIILQSERFGSLTYVTQWMTNDPDTFCADEPVADDEGFLFCNGVLEAENGPVGDEMLSEVEGKTVAYVDAASTSGFLIPALQLLEAGIDPQNDVDALFAGGHDNAVIALYNGDADVGLSFNDARGNVVGEFPDVGEKVVVWGWSNDIPNDGFSVRNDLPEDLKNAITEALLDYASTEEGREVLNAIYNIDNLVPADASAYDIIRNADAELGDLTE